jgi:hypothetical protein
VKRRALAALAALALAGAGTAQAEEAGGSDRFFDTQDGQFDLSRHLLEFRGMLPVPVIITEPAVGTGGGVVGLYFDQPLGEALKTHLSETGKPIPPNITAIGGFGTENGTWGGFFGHRHTWDSDRWRYLGGIGKASINFDYYGLLDQPRALNVDGWGFMQQLLGRIGQSDLFLGARYAWLTVQPRFDGPWPAALPRPEVDAVRIGRLSFMADHDTRDNLFSPSDGHFLEAEAVAASPSLGGSTSYQQLVLKAFNWSPVGKDFVLGLRGEAQFSRGDIPFFAKPFVVLRGIPSARYQDDNVAVAEVEGWWQATPRWSLLAFGGAGKAWGERNGFSDTPARGAGGVGFRYLIARLLGIHAGLDVARGPEGNAVYIQVGSPWR